MKDTPSICGACKKLITICEVCGGKKCVKDCPDRKEDGCRCEEDYSDDCECAC